MGRVLRGEHGCREPSSESDREDNPPHPSAYKVEIRTVPPRCAFRPVFGDWLHTRPSSGPENSTSKPASASFSRAFSARIPNKIGRAHV